MSFPDNQAILNKALQIRSIAEDMNKLNNVDLQNAADSITTVWRGEAASVYLRQYAATRDILHGVADELLNEANNLEQFARLQEAELGS